LFFFGVKRLGIKLFGRLKKIKVKKQAKPVGLKVTGIKKGEKC